MLNRLRESREGQLYVAEFGTRMRGRGIFATLVEQRFCLACRKHGLAFEDKRVTALDASRFRVPPRPGDQLKLL